MKSHLIRIFLIIGIICTMTVCVHAENTTKLESNTVDNYLVAMSALNKDSHIILSTYRNIHIKKCGCDVSVDQIERFCNSEAFFELIGLIEGTPEAHELLKDKINPCIVCAN